MNVFWPIWFSLVLLHDQVKYYSKVCLMIISVFCYTVLSSQFWIYILLVFIASWNWIFISRNLQDITLQEAETIALSILKQVMEEKVGFAYRHKAYLRNIILPSDSGYNTLGLFFVLVRWLQTTLILQRWLKPIISTPLPKWRLSSLAYEISLCRHFSTLLSPSPYSWQFEDHLCWERFSFLL